MSPSENVTAPDDARFGGRELIDEVLAEAPNRRVLDLGCGEGREARRLAALGYEVVGIDASEEVLERARSSPLPEGVELLLGDMGAVERLVRGHFGAAVCLGNTLPALLSPESLARMFAGLKRRLLPDAPVVLELLNYDRLGAGEAILPSRFEATDAGRRIRVEVVEPRGDGVFLHRVAHLDYHPAERPFFDLAGSRGRQLRGWTRTELETVLEVARLPVRAAFGDLSGGAFDPRISRDLVLVAG